MEEQIEDLKVDFNAVLASGGGSLSESQFMRKYIFMCVVILCSLLFVKCVLQLYVFFR